MPLPLIIPVVAAIAGAWAIGKGAGEMAKDQSAEFNGLRLKLQNGHQQFTEALEEKVDEFKTLASERIERAATILSAQSVDLSDDDDALDDILHSANLPGAVREALENLGEMQGRHHDLTIESVSQHSEVMQTVSRAAPYINGTHSLHRYVPPQLGPIAAVAVAGAVVWETGNKLVAVVSNANSLKELRSAHAEMTRAYSAHLDAADEDYETFDEASSVIIEHLTQIDPYSDSINYPVMQALYRALAQTMRSTLE